MAVELNTKGAGDELMPERIQAALRELVEMETEDGWPHRYHIGGMVVDITELNL